MIAALVLFVLWISPGLVGRDLWKADEPYSFGLVYHISKTGDWIVPTLAGEPFMEKPPIFYLTAAGFVRIFSPWLEPHDASRLASAFFMLMAVLFTGLTAKELIGPDTAGSAMLMLIGSIGLQITAHKLITDIALIAGLSAAFYGFALCRRRSLLGGFWVGTGAGIGFLSKGLLAPGLVGLIALTLPLFFSDWRRRAFFSSLLVSLIAALPWLVVWPLALYHRSPQLFIEWFWYQNLGRFLGYGNVGRRFSSAFYLINLPWFALPSLPLAFWTVLQYRKGLWKRAEIQLSLTTFLVMLSVFSLSSSIRTIYALPMLLPLTLLAAVGIDSLPQSVRKAANRTVLVLFGFLASILWFGWIAIMLGRPSSFANYLHRLQPDYIPHLNVTLLLAACFYTIAWIITVIMSPRFKNSYLLNWTAGMTFTWALAMTLWLPWIDAGSGYRSMFSSLRERIPGQCRYILALGLGESERALLVYYTGVYPRPIAAEKSMRNDFLLIQSGSQPKNPPAGSDWQVIWEWRRPVNSHESPKEIFTLYERNGDENRCE